MAQEKSGKLGIQRLASWLTVPAPALANVTHMEVEGNSQVRIENCGAILLYQPEEIRIRTGKLVTQFLGRELSVRCLSEDCMEIHGCLCEIHFLR